MEHEGDRDPYTSEVELDADCLNLIWSLIVSEFYLLFDWLGEWSDRITPNVSMFPRQWNDSGSDEDEMIWNRKKNGNTVMTMRKTESKRCIYILFKRFSV